MTSHVYKIDWKRVAREASTLFIFAGLFALAVHVWLWTHPKLRAAAEPLPVRSIIAKKWEMSLKPADLLLIGDSSCLMDVDAPLLEEHLERIEKRPVSVVNLGMVSSVRMDSFATLIGRSVAANPGRLKRVVLLAHPEMLRREESRSFALKEEEIYTALTPGSEMSWREQCLYWTGLDCFERVVLWDILPSPQPNQWGAFYGFQTGVKKYLEMHKGSAVEVTSFRGKSGESRFKITEAILEESKGLRAALPEDIQLIVGLMPTAAGFVGTNFPNDYMEMKARWSEAIRPNHTLTNIRATMPDSFFGTYTHLTKDGQRVFTRWLAEELGRISEKDQ